MVVDRLRGDAEFGGDLLVRHPHPAAHLEDAARLFGQTGERFVVQTRQLGTEIEVGGFETFGEALAQLLVDAPADPAGGRCRSNALLRTIIKSNPLSDSSSSSLSRFSQM